MSRHFHTGYALRTEHLVGWCVRERAKLPDVEGFLVTEVL